VTIEIRQMVIKSSIERGAADSGREKASANDECEECGGNSGNSGGNGGGNSEGNLGGSEERRRLRMQFAAESERMRER
jgi:hypothetical protein